MWYDIKIKYMIKNYNELIQNSIGKNKIAREYILKCLESGLSSIDPKILIKKNISFKDDILKIQNTSFNIKGKKVFVIGYGKASGKMAESLENILGNKIHEGLVIVPHKKNLFFNSNRIKIRTASHPIPDINNVKLSNEIIDITKKASDSLLICLISGGGSALSILPDSNIEFEDKVLIINQLIKAGATINEINIVRKHLSKIKGGRLAMVNPDAQIVSLILSDVVGDDLSDVSSGPTVPDLSTFNDAINLLKKYDLWEDGPKKIKSHFETGNKNTNMETPKFKNQFKHVKNFLMGTNDIAVTQIEKTLKSFSIKPFRLTTFIEGESREIGIFLGSLAQSIIYNNQPIKKPCCILIGGESTVTVKGNGEGGRNQELVLSCSELIKNIDGVVVASIGTDGVDGFTDVNHTKAAGAIADSLTISKSIKKSLSQQQYLNNNDSYNFFNELNDLIITDLTGTNAMDLTLLIII